MAGPVRIAILANGSQARREFQQTSNSLTKMSGVAKGAGLLMAAGVLAFGKSAIDVERKFSTSMRLIKASTGAPAAEMDKLNKLAIKLGQDTSFSAGEAADAMLELAKAGLDTKTIMGGGLAGTLQLAAAGGTDLATAATIASNALNTFNLRGKDMASVSAALAGGANASTASVESLGQALQQVGPGAINAGLSLQETVAALAAFDANGIKGADAGTSLKTMLTRLVPATKAAATAMEENNLSFTNADGSFKSLTQISGQLQHSLGKLSDEQRVQALTAIFGSDATRAATVLMKEGSRGIRGYIKATKDQNAAQELAAARMSGTEGALEKLSGAVETAKLRLGQELAPAITAGAGALDDKLVPALEGGIEAGKKIGEALAPAVSEIVDALGHLAGEGDAVGHVFNDILIPALTTTSEVVGGLVDFFDDLPGPVKEVGLQVGVAALVFPRLAAGVTGATTAMSLQIARLQQLRAEMTYTATRAQLTGAAMEKMAGAAKAAAGIGGMLLLAQGAKETNETLSILEATAGGTALGFSVGGPWGAAIGGAGGLIVSLGKALSNTDEKANISNTTWQTYASTMDDVTAATTKATRSMIAQELQNTGTLNAAAKLGIDKGVLVNGILGEKKARGQLTAAMKEQENAIAALKADPRFFEQSAIGKGLQQEASDRQTLVDKIREETGERVKGNKAAIELAAIANRIPEEVQTKITTNAIDSARDIAKLAYQYDLTPKQIQTVIKLSEVETTKGAVQDIKSRLESVGDVNSGEKWRNRLRGDLTGAAGDTRANAGDINAFLGLVGDKAPKVRHGAFGQGLAGDLSQLKTLASGGGTGVGNNLGSGMYLGLGFWINPIAARAAGMVRGAVSAANAAGAIESPSRETMKTGSFLGEGLVVGMRRQEPAARAGGKALVLAVRAGVDDGRSGVDGALAKITAQIRKSITGKHDEKKENRLLKQLADEYKALKRNGNAQDRINDKLKDQRDRLKELKQELADYSKSIKDAFIATGDVTQLGKQEDGTVSITSLLNELKNRINGAERFEVLTEQLAKQGLSQASIQQLLAAGPEAALATAEAIAAGGASAITEMNDLQARLAASGDRLGDQMADRYYGAGVDAAAGIVKGLEAEAARLDAAAVKLANALVAAVKKALGIKSPSKVFAGIGGNVAKGLVVGLDANTTYVRRAGADQAASLEKGFGKPVLTAYATARAASGSVDTVRVRLTAEQVSTLQQGRELQMKLDYARSNGVVGETF